MIPPRRKWLRNQSKQRGYLNSLCHLWLNVTITMQLSLTLLVILKLGQPQSHIAAIQIFHDSERNHWISTSFQDGEVKLYDSHFRGGISSCLELQIVQMYSPLVSASSGGLLVSVVPLQQQSSRSLNCGPFCIAAGYHAASGDDLGSLTFDECKLRQHLVNCFETEELAPFPLAPPEMTVRRAEQKHVLIEVNCKCGRPDSFQDMVAAGMWWLWSLVPSMIFLVVVWKLHHDGAIDFVKIVRVSINFSFPMT